MTRTNSEKRPWLGALLSFFVPGLGHVYLKEWLRSAMWFAFMISAVLLFVPIPDVATGGSASAQSAFEAAMEATRNLPLEALVPLWMVRVFGAVDAYWLALRAAPGDGDGDDGMQCPSCGKSVDEDLDFCQWCTTPLPERDGPNSPAESNAMSR